MIIFFDTSSFLDDGACGSLFLSGKGHAFVIFCVTDLLLSLLLFVVVVVVRVVTVRPLDEERVGYVYCGESAFVVIKAT